MSVGLPVTKDELDSRTGDLCRRFQQNFGDVVTLQQYLTSQPDEVLIAFGYTPEEVATLKSAFADLEQLGNIWIGAEGLATPKDFRAFVKALWGVGAF